MNKLGGWWRLWLVFSVLVTASMLFTAISSPDVQDYTPEIPGAAVAAWNEDALHKVRACGFLSRPAVLVTREPSGTYIGYYSCTSRAQYGLVALMGIIVSGLIAGVGLTVRWIYRGFRRKP